MVTKRPKRKNDGTGHSKAMCTRTRKVATHLAQAENSLFSLSKTKGECPLLKSKYLKYGKLVAKNADKVRTIHRNMGCGTIKKPKRR